MQTHQADYFGAYRTMKMMRDTNGVLVVEFHSNGGRCTFSAQHHAEVVDAFHRIAQDRANKIVILTGAEGDFIIGVDWNSFGDVSDPGVWNGRALSRARELAALYLKAPEVTRRYTRIHFIQPLKERILRELGYGLSLEGASSAALARSRVKNEAA